MRKLLKYTLMTIAAIVLLVLVGCFIITRIKTPEPVATEIYNDVIDRTVGLDKDLLQFIRK